MAARGRFARKLLAGSGRAASPPGPETILTGGATAAALGIVLPCYLFVVIPARYFRRAVHDARVKAFVDGVSVAAAGAIAGAAFVLGRRAVFDVTTLAIAAVTLLLITRLRAHYEPLVILGAGLAGLAWSGGAP